jgi:hypothetical protein
VPSLLKEVDRQATVDRVVRLTPSSRGLWGRMTAEEMLSHLGKALRMALGDLTVAPVGKAIFTVFPVKHLLAFVLPFPKNVPTAHELLPAPTASVEVMRDEVVELLGRFATVPHEGNGPRHPLFGVLTWKQWGVLQYRHADHHLRQFGISR